MGSDAVAAFGARPVFVHAHPDDEAISTGGTLAALVEAGASPTLLTGTRGERGEVVEGPLHPLEGTEALGPHRVGELAAALAAIGPVAHAFLGSRPARVDGRPERVYADSGMRWGADGFAEAAADAPPGALSLAPFDEVVADVLAGMPVGATSVIGYDALGGYGHPDHVRMHEAGLEAARLRGLPYFAIVEPRVRPGDHTADDHTADDHAAGDDALGVLISLDLTPGQLAAKVAAMAAHATQLTIGTDADGTATFTLSGGQTHPVGTVETFRRLR